MLSQPQIPQQGPPGGTGNATAPRPMMGNATSALSLVHTAMESLQKALIGLPMGSEIHTAVLKAITDLGKKINNEQGDKSSMLQQLSSMGRNIQANPQAEALQRMQAQQQPTQPPAMPGGGM